MASWITSDLPDNRGLIYGFLLQPHKPAESINWDTIATALQATDGVVWVHLNLVDVRAQNWLYTCDSIPRAARETLTAINFRNFHFRLETVSNSIVGLLGDLHHDFASDPESLGMFLLYLDEHRMITGRRYPLKSVNRLRDDILDGIEIESSLHLLARLVQHPTEVFGQVITHLNDTIDDIEDRILKGRFHNEGDSLGEVRRLLARLRRHIGTQRTALSQLMPRLPPWSREADNIHLSQTLDRIDRVTQDVELLQERARLLQEERANRLTEATNRNLYFLSIVTTVFLPITLITGIFGMNVGGLPWLDDQSGFWWVMAVMSTTLAVSLMMLRLQRFF